MIILPTLREQAMNKRGFTLVELAVVLVIVGLIVGGVMAGRDLIRGAQARAQVSQVDKIRSAILTFKLKYNCIPGDCSTATNFFGAASQPERVTNGNGNGVICMKAPYEGTSTACEYSGTNITMSWWIASDASESASVFDHLAAAGLFDFGQYDESVVSSNTPGVGFPILKLQGTGVQTSTTFGGTGGVIVTSMKPYLYSNGGHKIMLGGCGYNGTGQLMIFSCGYKPIEAFELDSKIDDGLPLTGKMILSGTTSYVYRVPGDSNVEVNCNTTGTNNQYATSISYAGFNARRCVPMIEAGF